MKSKRLLVVSNAGPLIHLSKINQLNLLKDMYEEVVIPHEVKVETVNHGRERGFPDAIQIEDAINEGWIRVEEIKISAEFTELAQITGLNIAEVAVIYYAYKNNGTALLDEDSARTFARTLGIPIRGSLGLVLQGLRRNLLSREEALKALEQLSEIMYLSADLYRIMRDEIEKK